MLVSDILHSCTHRNVAAAAVASIGGDFAATVRRRAAGEGLSVGDFAASQVRMFSGTATERDWRIVAARMQGQDLALLSGLETVLMRMMSDERGTRAEERRAIG